MTKSRNQRVRRYRAKKREFKWYTPTLLRKSLEHARVAPPEHQDRWAWLVGWRAGMLFRKRETRRA